MFRNKKSLMLETLVRVIIVVAVFLLIVFPACNKIKEVFYGEKDIELFDEFVDSIKELKEGQKPVFLRLKEKNQAVVGFSKDGSEFQSISVVLRTMEHGIKLIGPEFKKPSECSDNACICFCRKGLKQDGKFTSCENINCRKLENVDIVDSNLILINPYIYVGANQGDYRYWKNGFFFGRSLEFIYNGLPEEKSERIVKIIEKRRIGDKLFLGVCDPKMYEDIKGTKNYRQEYFGSSCIVTEYEEGKKFEELAKNPAYTSPSGAKRILDKILLYRNAIKKYEEFIKKYEGGFEVEEAMYRMARIYKEELKDNEKSREICIEFIEKYPDSEIKYKCQVMWADISSESMAEV